LMNILMSHYTLPYWHWFSIAMIIAVWSNNYWINIECHIAEDSSFDV
jgi:hypothetical protein